MDEDAQYAHQLMKEEQLRKNERKVSEEDEELAKRIHREELEQLRRER